MKWAYTRPDGGVSVVVAAPKEHLERARGPMSDEEYEARVREKSIPADAADVIRLPEDWQPPLREKRDKWRIENGRIVVKD